MDTLDTFLMGALAMASWVVGLFFLKFWSQTRDRLLASFAIAFWLLGLTRIGLAAFPHPSEEHSYWYYVRLAAYLIILYAIIDKNRTRKQPPVEKGTSSDGPFPGQ